MTVNSERKETKPENTNWLSQVSQRSIPDISRFVIRSVVFFTVVGVLVFTMSSLRNFHFTLTLGDTLSRVIYFAFDPGLLHLVGGVLLVVVLFISSESSNQDSPKSGRRRLLRAGAFALVLILCVLVVAVVSEYLVFKPIFSEPRPDDRIAEPPVAAFFSDAVKSVFPAGLSTEDGHTSTPSGYVVRQLLLFYLVLVFAQKLVSRKKLFVPVVLLVSMALVVLVAVSRVLTGAHTFYDAGVSLAVSALTFWPPFIAIYAFLKKKDSEACVVDIAVLCMLLIPICFVLSEDSGWWVAISLFMFGFLALGYVRASGRELSKGIQA